MLRVYKATTPAAYMDMYKDGGPSSCMTLDPDNVSEWVGMQQWDCPTAFYAYVPGMFGLYVKDTKKNIVLARTVVHTANDGNLAYTNVYTDEDVYWDDDTCPGEKLLLKHLKRLGAEQRGNVDISLEFEIPARELAVPGETTLYFPVPSFDGACLAKGYKYMKRKKVFKIRVGMPRLDDFKPFSFDTSGYVKYKP